MNQLCTRNWCKRKEGEKKTLNMCRKNFIKGKSHNDKKFIFKNEA